MIFIYIESTGLLFLLLCSAFFSSAETALFSLNPIQVRRIGKSSQLSGDRIEKLLSAPTKLLSTILTGNTLVNVAAAGLAFHLAEKIFPGRGMAISIPVMTLLLLLFGEVTPKRLAMSRPEKLAVLYAPLLSVLIRVMAPVRKSLEFVSDIFRKEVHVTSRSLSEDEFLTVVEVGEEEGVLDEEEREMVDGIIRLEEIQASDVMTPRVDLVGIDLDDPPEEADKKARSVNYRYLPVYRGSLDHREGFLDVPVFVLSEGCNIEEAMIPSFAVPENIPLDALLANFQDEDRKVAYVVDEYGGTAGLVTRGDVLEEIVDDVDNEYGGEKLTIQKVRENLWIVDGSTSLEEINYELDMFLEADGSDRIAGWVMAQVKRIPKPGETVEAQGCRVQVQGVRRNRITLVMLEKL